MNSCVTPTLDSVALLQYTDAYSYTAPMFQLIITKYPADLILLKTFDSSINTRRGCEGNLIQNIWNRIKTFDTLYRSYPRDLSVTGELCVLDC